MHDMTVFESRTQTPTNAGYQVQFPLNKSLVYSVDCLQAGRFAKSCYTELRASDYSGLVKAEYYTNPESKIQSEVESVVKEPNGNLKYTRLPWQTPTETVHLTGASGISLEVNLSLRAPNV